MSMFFSPSTLGFYVVGQDRPEDAIAISDAEYDAAMLGQSQGKRIVSGNGKPALADPFTEIPLAAFKISLCRQIDTAAEAERLKYITPGAGQAMTYQAKAEEARRYTLDPADPAGFPLLSAEVGVTGATLAEVAQVVGDAYAAWLMIGAAIEAVRLAAKAAVNAAADHAGAQAAATAVAWPS